MSHLKPVGQLKTLPQKEGQGAADLLQVAAQPQDLQVKSCSSAQSSGQSSLKLCRYQKEKGGMVLNFEDHDFLP